MALYLIGLGLWDEKDITVKGLEAIKKCEHVYLEGYTSKLNCTKEDLEKLYEKKLTIADRKLVEDGKEILDNARKKDVALLVIGDPFGATTHTDLKIRAMEAEIKVETIHNASIINAVASTGIDLYKFGRITSIPFENENIKSPLTVIKQNQEHGLSTLVLFDLDPINNRFMQVKEALEFLLRIGMKEETLCIGCAGIGSPTPEIKTGKAINLQQHQFNLTPQCLIIPGKTHFMEDEMIKKFSID